MTTETRQTRFRPGQIRDAIVTCLESQHEGASVAEIQEAAARLLKAELAGSSVRSYLRLNTPGLFERIEFGRYRINPVELPRPKQQFLPVYQHGRSVLFGADCLDWLASQEKNSIHAVVTDPPYGLVEYSHVEQQKLRSGQGGTWRIPPSFDGHKRSPLPRFTTLTKSDHDYIVQFFFNWANTLYPVLVPGAHVVVAANPLLSHLIACSITDAGFERRGEIIRLVMTMRGGDRPKNAHEEFPEVSVMSRSMWEPWLVFRKPIEGRVQDNLRKWKTGGLRRPSLEKPFGDVIQSHPTRKSERAISAHPSLKPQDFLRQVVRAVLPLGEGIVLDPFAGSGSTLAAAEAVGYQSIGVELDPHFIEIAKNAIPKLAKIAIRPKAGKSS